MRMTIVGEHALLRTNGDDLQCQAQHRWWVIPLLDLCTSMPPKLGVWLVRKLFGIHFER